MADVDVARLRKVPLFAPLGEEEVQAFADAAELTEHAEGELLTEQGVLGYRFHLLLDGGAVVERDGRRVATLAAGDFVGEIGLLGGGPSLATVRCTAPARCLTLRREEFWGVLQAEPEIALRLLEVVARRLEEQFGPHAAGNLPG
ncbi:MAG TPA: cyclic nucleotide-binding domain-containing protein [Actinomycetota bacterium]|nr:cyclic nucleotide-binding domain-containing protein [Actinomycetota bacterium]